MRVLERHVQTVVNEKAYDVWEKKWVALEKQAGGFPAKNYYNVLSGPESMNVIVWEREWESMAVLEAAYSKMLVGADDLFSEGPSIVTNERLEFYLVKVL